MKLKIFLFFISVFFLKHNTIMGQNSVPEKILNQSIDQRIIEVYGNHLDELISRPLVLQSINEILQKRTQILVQSFFEGEKIDNLSNYPLFNQYNPSLQRDDNENPYLINVLKYDLPFYPKILTKYRIGTSQFILIIFPINYSEE